MVTQAQQAQQSGCKIRFHVVLTHLIVCILQLRSQGSTTEVRGSHPTRLPIMRLFSFQPVNRESHRNPQLNAASSLQCKISEMASKLTTYYRERKRYPYQRTCDTKLDRSQPRCVSFFLGSCSNIVEVQKIRQRYGETKSVQHIQDNQKTTKTALFIQFNKGQCSRPGDHEWKNLLLRHICQHCFVTC